MARNNNNLFYMLLILLLDATTTGFVIAPLQELRPLARDALPFQSPFRPRHQSLQVPARRHRDNTRIARAMGIDPFDVPRPDPAILISAKPSDEQKLWVGGMGVILIATTAATVSLLSAVESALPYGWFGTLGSAFSVPLGLIFAALGAAHFAKKETFLGIVPPPGTWGGLWGVPAPGAEELGLSYEEYHTYWTGACELAGGLILAASGLGLLPEAVQRLDASLLFLLTLAVTPANIYMATHDAQMDGGPPPMAYPDAHVFRGAIQAVLLGGFWKLAFH